MKTKPKCIVCHERPREVPDRYAQGRPIKKLCRQCHAARLVEDIRRGIDTRSKLAQEFDAYH